MTYQPSPLLSPDGRFYWDGNEWMPVPAGQAGGPPVVAAFGSLGPRRHAFGYWFASLIITGLGTMLAGRFLRGLFLFILEGLLILGSYIVGTSGLQLSSSSGGTTRVTILNQEAVFVAGVLVVLSFFVWIYGMVDAVRSVYRWNRAHGYTY